MFTTYSSLQNVVAIILERSFCRASNSFIICIIIYMLLIIIIISYFIIFLYFIVSIYI